MLLRYIMRMINPTCLNQHMPSPAPVTNDPTVTTLAQLAMAMMAEHHIAPLPEHYAVWYHYAQAKNSELVKEIEMILKNKVPFSPHTNMYLYNKYVVPDRNSKIISDTAENTNKLMGEVLKAVTEFSGETKHYNKDVDAYMGKMPVDIPDPTVQALVRELLTASSEIRERGEHLNARLEESRQEIEALRKNLEQVTNESQRDFLTGVFNRKSFDRMLDEQLAHANQQGQELCLLMLDIDHFKQFNDKFGHLLGDEVLKIVARSMTDCVRGKDMVARYGGEEFAIILPATPLAGGIKVAETIRSTIAKRELKRRDTGEAYGALTVSVGVAHLRGSTDTPLSLVKRADEALYYSKHHGRNRVTGEGDML